jgi:hypothetical protein
MGAALALGLLLLGACGSGGEVAMPPDDASPQEVVRTYVEAINEGDVDTARQLLTPQRAKNVGAQADSFFDNVNSITKLELLPERPEFGSDYKFAVKIPVTFDLDQKEEMSMPDGPTDWGYLLGRNATNEPWRIYDEGVA